jgi:hypothetical protein
MGFTCVFIAEWEMFLELWLVARLPFNAIGFPSLRQKLG